MLWHNFRYSDLVSQCYVTVPQLVKTALSCRIKLLLKSGHAHWGAQSVDCGIALSHYCLPLCHFCTLHPSQHSSLVEMETSFSLHAQTHSHSWCAAARTPGLCEADVRSPCRLCWAVISLGCRPVLSRMVCEAPVSFCFSWTVSEMGLEVRGEGEGNLSHQEPLANGSMA